MGNGIATPSFASGSRIHWNRSYCDKVPFILRMRASRYKNSFRRRPVSQNQCSGFTSRALRIGRKNHL